MHQLPKSPLVRHAHETKSIPCPYGDVARIVTGGEGGVANVHVITVTDGDPHFHSGYDEVYYFLAGFGKITIDGVTYAVQEGSVAVIPRGVVHSICSDTHEPLRFVIFGTPAMSADSSEFQPRRP